VYVQINKHLEYYFNFETNKIEKMCVCTCVGIFIFFLPGVRSLQKIDDENYMIRTYTNFQLRNLTLASRSPSKIQKLSYKWRNTS